MSLTAITSQHEEEHLMQATSEQTTSATPQDAMLSRYYQVVFIWMKDPATFGRYVALLGPVVRPYGGGLERRLIPDAIYAEGMAKPDIVNIVFYDNRAAFMAFDRDPEFAKIVHLRSEAIDMASVAGVPLGEEVTRRDEGNRLYLVEVARFGPQGAAAYQEYEEQAEPLIRRYGYHVERRLAPVSASGFPFQPDLIKVAYFDSPDGMERLHKDPAHLRIENELYPAAVQQSIWVIGRVDPMTLEAE
jgi:uncharacterized protein (DUF1330 family)